MSDELTDDVISQWLEVAAPCLFAAWQYGQTPDDADPVAWFAEVYGQGAPGPVHAVHVIGDDGRTVAVTGNGPRSAAHAKFMAWSSPGNVSKLLRDFRAMRERALAAERLLSDERTAHAETSHNLDALLTALGAQVTPGGQTLAAGDARRVADGLRLAKREVPADVEAAIRAAIDGAVASGEARALRHASLLTGEPFCTEPRLRTAIAAEIERARAEGRAEAPAAPATVGGLLATGVASMIVEFFEDSTGCWTQIAWRGGVARLRVYNYDGWFPIIEWHIGELVCEWMEKPARVVGHAEADADPASRGPIGGGS